MTRKNFSFFFFSAVVLLSVTGFATWVYIENNFTMLPYFGNGRVVKGIADVQKNSITPVPAFSFINQEEKIIDNSFVKDKIWVADFFFTRCGSICPKMSSHLQQVQREFSWSDDVKIVSFTCDPENDNPKQLNEYANAYQAKGKQWQFATGDKKMLYRFARKGLNIVAADGDGGANDFIHSQNLVLIDSKGFIRGYYDGTDKQSVKQLIVDIKKLL